MKMTARRSGGWMTDWAVRENGVAPPLPSLFLGNDVIPARIKGEVAVRGSTQISFRITQWKRDLQEMFLLFALGYILEQKVVPVTALHSINNLGNRRGVSHFFLIGPKWGIGLCRGAINCLHYAD